MSRSCAVAERRFLRARRVSCNFRQSFLLRHACPRPVPIRTAPATGPRHRVHRRAHFGHRCERGRIEHCSCGVCCGRRLVCLCGRRCVCLVRLARRCWQRLCRCVRTGPLFLADIPSASVSSVAAASAASVSSVAAAAASSAAAATPTSRTSTTPVGGESASIRSR